jgi:hypothetical protein
MAGWKTLEVVRSEYQKEVIKKQNETEKNMN